MSEDDKIAEAIAQITSAQIAATGMSPDETITFIGRVRRSLKYDEPMDRQATTAESMGDAPERVVSIEQSLADPDKIISMIDGKPYSTLTRHIGKHGFKPDTYRKAFGLPDDYPMIAPSYKERRAEIAKTNGLGRPFRAKRK